MRKGHTLSFTLPVTPFPQRQLRARGGWRGQVWGQRWGSWNVCLLLYQVLFLPPPGGEIISCQNRSQITGNCSSPNYLVLIGD